jgi:hypothetical protein
MSEILETKEITPADIKINTTYFAKRRTVSAFGNNDRYIIWIGATTLQYDSDTVRMGSKHPTISIEKFCKWAGGIVHIKKKETDK